MRDIELLKSHHYRSFDKTDKAYKECLSPRLPSIPSSLLVGILMSVRPTLLPLALLLLIFLPLFAPCSFPPFLFLSLPPPLPSFFSTASPRRCHKLCDCNVSAAAPMPRTIFSFLSVSYRWSKIAPASRKSTLNRIREEIKAGLEANELRVCGYEIYRTRGI